MGFFKIVKLIIEIIYEEASSEFTNRGTVYVG